MCQGSDHWGANDNPTQSATYECSKLNEDKDGYEDSEHWEILQDLDLNTTLQLYKFKAEMNGGSVGLKHKSFLKWTCRNAVSSEQYKWSQWFYPEWSGPGRSVIPSKKFKSTK